MKDGSLEAGLLLANLSPILHGNISKADLAYICGVHPTYIGQIERGALGKLRKEFESQLEGLTNMDLDKQWEQTQEIARLHKVSAKNCKCFACIEVAFATCELDAEAWAVVTVDFVIAFQVTYAEACDTLTKADDPYATIVTCDVAQRMIDKWQTQAIS